MCFMPLKTKLRWAECPDEPPRWTQGVDMALTAKQKKLPKALQQAILKKMKKNGKKKEKKKQRINQFGLTTLILLKMFVLGVSKVTATAG